VNDAVKAAALAIILVFAGSTLFGWQMWRLGKRLDRQGQEPGYSSKNLRRGGFVYAGAAVLGIAFVSIGELPKESLVGLPIVMLLRWSLFRAAAKVKAAPK